MHAIEITEETLPKILELDPSAGLMAEIGIYIPALAEQRTVKWMLVQGYCTQRGEFIETPVIVPSYIFRDNFEYDPDKIKTDWDQIVRK